MKEIKDYLHLYLGCKIVGSDYDNNCREGYLTGVSNGGYDCEIQFFTHDGVNVEEEPAYNETKDVKIILRRFPSDMTDADEEATGLNKNYENGHSVLTPNEYLYLLKNGFDLFGLIDDGLAIDATTLAVATPKPA